MQNFSGAILLSDLDDYLNPSQTCIKPVVVEKKPNRGRAVRRIEIDQESGNVSQIVEPNPQRPKAENKIQLNKVQITLSDCLACSGCVTSAESILVNQQSVDEVINKLQSRGSKCRKQLFVASISTQTFVSYAARFSAPLDICARRICAALRRIGFDIILDVGVARSISLIASATEFSDHLKNKTPNLPIFASSCPGWICYAEKTAGDFILPHISRVKSPQQIMGILVKHFVAKHYCYAPEDVFHLSVMPCYDKKLEASRHEFTLEGTENCRHVDSVLTSGEIGQLLEKMNVTFDENFTEESDFDLPVIEGKQHAPLIHPGSGSGGFAEHLLRYAYKEINDLPCEKAENVAVDCKMLRNEDMQELSIEGFDVKIAVANGFRNIQNVVHRLKTNRSSFPWSYIEIMACPTGCVGGGGQLPILTNAGSVDGDNGVSMFRANREMVAKMKKAFYEDPCENRKTWAWNEKLGMTVYEMLKRDDILDLLFTDYRAVEQTVTKSLKW